jgi:hypothetical protein
LLSSPIQSREPATISQIRISEARLTRRQATYNALAPTTDFRQDLLSNKMDAEIIALHARYADLDKAAVHYVTCT